MKLCKRIHYRGTVQGVGFRMTARRLADRFAVAGYVRNLADGRVELVVAGESAEIDRYLGAVAKSLAEYIHGRDDEEVPLQSFDGFEIRT